MNVAQLFERTARRDPDAPAVALGSRPVLAYRELCRQAAALAAGMATRFGAAAGDRVLVVAENRADYVELLLACWWAGLAAVPVNAKLHPKELAWIFDNADPRLCFTSTKLASAVNEAGSLSGGSWPVLEFGSTDYERLAASDPVPMADVGADAMAWLFYTSGTTGQPKGAMITHGNLRAMTYAYLIDVDEVGPREAILHAAPMSHGSGLYILPHAAAGSVQVVPESGGFDEAEVFALIEAHPRAHMFAAPTMIKRLTRWAKGNAPDTHNLATFIYGGAPMYLADLDEAHEVFGFRLAQLYGQGEAPMCITGLNKRQHEEAAVSGRKDRLQSAGTQQIVVDVRIGDEEGRPLPAGETGEVMARGASVVPGYWRNPDATATTMGHGWLRTGDVGSLDKDGYLTLKDRSKDLIISGGANIYPREVEEVLLRHPGVHEVSVVGLPDPQWGEIVVACVVASEAVGEDELNAHCLNEMARFKRPKRYVLLDALPKSSYGKVLKRELRVQLAKGQEGP